MSGTNIGVLIDGLHARSKKEIRERVKSDDLSSIELYPTSALTGGFCGTLDVVPNGEYYFVGPDPYTKRNFYGTITVKEGKVKVS